MSENLPIPSGAGNAFYRGPRLKLVKKADYFSEKLWREHQVLSGDDARRERLLRRLNDAVRVAEHNCRAGGLAPGALPAPSRRALGWMRFLCHPAHLQAHLACLERCRHLAEQHLGLRAARVEWHLRHTPSLYRLTSRGPRVVICVNEGYLFAEEAVWQALGAFLLGKRRSGDRRLIRSYATGAAFAEIVHAMDGLPEERQTAGSCYDLEGVFDRVNLAYFDGELNQPRLEWSDRRTRRQFGFYRPASDTLRISRTLDNPALPRYVIDFVMYHELLHKKLGVVERKGRIIAHSTEFRRAEKAFPHYQAAMDWLKKLALGED